MFLDGHVGEVDERVVDVPCSTMVTMMTMAKKKKKKRRGGGEEARELGEGRAEGGRAEPTQPSGPPPRQPASQQHRPPSLHTHSLTNQLELTTYPCRCCTWRCRSERTRARTGTP